VGSFLVRQPKCLCHARACPQIPLTVEHPPQKMADQFELHPVCFLPPVHACITSRMCSTTARWSCSRVSCPKMPSNDDSCIDSRKCSMESCAATRPLQRISTREHTFSSTSRTWEL